MDDNSTSRSILNIRNLMVLAIFGLMIWFIIIVRGIIGIFLFSMVIAFLLYPLVETFYSRRIPRSLAIVIVYLIIFAVIGLISLIVVPPLVNQAQGVVNYIISDDGSSLFAEKVATWTKNSVETINERLGTNFEIREIYLANQEKLNALLGDIFNRTSRFVGSLASFVTLMVAIPVICFYLLMDWPKIRESLLKFLPQHIQTSTIDLMDHLTVTLNSYLRGQLKLSFLMFLITTAALLVLNCLGILIPSFGFYIGPWLLLGLLAGTTEVIPIVGPIIAFIPAVILGFINGPITGITVILLYAVIQLFEGNILVPKIMGDKMDVHPLTVMFALLCGGLLGGIGGMLLALPITATLKVIFEQYYPGFIKNIERLFTEQDSESAGKTKSASPEP
ncbi:AI-2E family transporter [bacterium]|nr:AI-2E family transporter [bacterium]